ncbi:conjugal transfer protein TraD [Acidithiobacillus ferridurans]|nr:conjugal transfer protein TraD [Acidithiobacillus ferridurans]
MASKAERLKKQYEESLAKAKTAKSALDKIRRDQDRKEKIAARKARNHALFMVGGLAEIAGLLDTDKGALLGGLLAIADSLKAGPGSSRFQQWKSTGDALLAEREAARPSPPVKTPATAPDQTPSGSAIV